VRTQLPLRMPHGAKLLTLSPGSWCAFETDECAGGSGTFALQLQVDYRIVPAGFADDERVLGHVDRLTGPRVFFGPSLRIRLW
jgi:hypothetical protein